MGSIENEIVSKEEFALWKDNKVTQAVEEMLTEIRQRQVEFLSEGGTLEPGNPSTDRVVGLIKGIDLFLSAELVEEDEKTYGH